MVMKIIGPSFKVALSLFLLMNWALVVLMKTKLRNHDSIDLTEANGRLNVEWKNNRDFIVFLA